MNIRKETDSEKDNLSSFTTIDLKKQKKEARQAAKLTKRKAYQDLSFRKKALYWGMRVIGAVAVCGLVLIIGVFCMNPILTLVDEWYFDYCSQKPVSKEEIYSEVPIDTDGAEGIAALPTLSLIHIFYEKNPFQLKFTMLGYTSGRLSAKQ